MAQPVVKWPGGKRQLLTKLKERMPKEYGIYFEPFFGGGALFFDICPKDAVVNDLNDQLINVYRQLKTKPIHVMGFLEKYQNLYNSGKTDEEKVELYYKIRDIFNSIISKRIFSPESAALLIVLNKAGFNGLYRVNKMGQYNVPSAHRKTLNCFDINNVLEVNLALERCEIRQGDFESACDDACKGDFVFFDSPYYDAFDTYQANGFSEEEHLRLFRLFKRLSERGTYCMLTNSNTDFIKEIYKDYKIEIT